MTIVGNGSMGEGSKSLSTKDSYESVHGEKNPLCSWLCCATSFGHNDSDISVVVVSLSFRFPDPLRELDLSAVVFTFDGDFSARRRPDVGDVSGVFGTCSYLPVNELAEV